MTISQSEKARLPRVGRVFIIAHKAEIFEAVMRGETLRSIYDNWSPAVPISYSRFAGLVRRWCGDPVGQLRATAVTRPKTMKEKAVEQKSPVASNTPSTTIFKRPESWPEVVEFDPEKIDLEQFK
jgi:hypothetical protein